MTGLLDVSPEVLNLESGGKYITGHLQLPDGYSVLEVCVPSVRLNGVVSAETCFTPHLYDTNKDNKGQLMLKFLREDVAAMLSPGPSVIVQVSGVLDDGTQFIASDVIAVIGR